MKEVPEKTYNKYINQVNEHLKVTDVLYQKSISKGKVRNILKLKCYCDLCGNYTIIHSGDLKRMKSCGCIKGIIAKERSKNSALKWMNKIFINNSGQKYKVINYENNKRVLIEFLETGSQIYVTTGHINDGEIKDPMTRSKTGYYIGQGPYRTSINKVKTICFTKFESMFSRCYDENQLLREPTYRDVEVCEEWHNFQNFAKWFEENWYEYDSPLELDKDLLSGNSKIYSPETCVFLPKSINSALKNNNITNLLILYDQHKKKLPKKIKKKIKDHIISIMSKQIKINF